jgi:hypothetical protein
MTATTEDTEDAEERDLGILHVSVLSVVYRSADEVV